MTKRMAVLLFTAIVVFGGVIGAKMFMNKKMGEYLDAMPIPAAVVSSAKAERDQWVYEVTSVGTVAAMLGANLTTEVSGIIEEIYFDSGSDVDAGDVIIALDSSTDRAELQTLIAAERLAELERDRVLRLWKSKSVSKAEYDQRLSQLEQAKTRVAAQNSRIEQKKVRALHAGRLGIRQVNIGQYVNAGDPMIGLNALDIVFINFTLPEHRFSEVNVGLPVRAQVDAVSDQIFEGKITAIEPVIDIDTRNFNVQATFANPQQLMHPGMYARVSLNVGEQRDVVIVPRTAISFKPYGNSVFVLTDTGNASETGDQVFHVKQHFVRTGETRGDLIVIDQGLAVGEQIASSGLLKLRSGGTAIVNNTVQPDAVLAPILKNE